MKKTIMILIALVTRAAVAASAPYAQVTVDWSSKDLEDTVLMVCDDSYYAGIDLTILGEGYRADSLELNGAMDWTVKSVRPTEVNGKKATLIRLKGSSSAELTIHQMRRQSSGQPLQFLLHIADGC